VRTFQAVTLHMNPQVVFGYFYGIFIFHDSHSIIGIFGSMIICVGVAAVSWPSKTTHPVSPDAQPSDLVAASKQSTLALQDYTILELSPLIKEEHTKSSVPLVANRVSS
jgi:drug/metabolite transporter (DMT)-like permease